MVCRKLHNERSRISGEDLCLLQDNTWTDNCCHTKEVCACCNPCSTAEYSTCDHRNERCLRTARDKCCCHDGHTTVTLILNCSGSHDTWDTTTCTNKDWNEGFTWKTEFTENSIHDEGDTCHVTAGLKNSQQEEQDKHLRYETKDSTNTGDNTIYDQTLKPFSTVCIFKQAADCIRNTADKCAICCRIRSFITSFW